MSYYIGVIIIKGLIKRYALRLKEEDVIKYCNKEGISVSKEEVDMFIKLVKENIDYIISGNGYKLLEDNKSSFSYNIYIKLNELIDKYSKFI